MTQHNRLFFVAYGGGHINLLLPVVKLAIAQGFDAKLLAMTTAANVARQAGIEALGFADLLCFAAPSAHEYGVELCRDMAADGPVPLTESIAYHGINFAELVANLGEDKAFQLYEAKGRHAFLPVQLFVRVLAELQPDVVIATNSPRSEQAAIIASGKLGIPAVCAVDLFALQEVKWIGQQSYADKICVLNESVKEMFLRAGRTEREVVVTGNPSFDASGGGDARRAGQRLREDRGWTDTRRTILWASQVEPAEHPFDGSTGDPELPRKVEGILREIVGGREDLRLVVRYHPSEQIPFAPGRNVEFSPTIKPLNALLHAVDLVIVTASTVGLEAYIVGKPVISVDMSVFTPDAPYSAMGISTGVSNLSSLAAAVKKWASSRSATAVSAVAQRPVDNVTAAQNVLNVILDLVPSSPE